MKPPSPSDQRLDVHEVTLSSPDLEATVRYRPVPGVRRLRCRASRGKPGKAYEAEGLMLGVMGRSLDGAGLSEWEPDRGTLDTYTRRRETVMESPATAACPVRLQAYWQVAKAGALDLQVLIASERLVAGVEVHTKTRLAAEHVLARIDRNGDNGFVDARRLAVGQSTEVTFARRRPQEDRLSIVEPSSGTRHIGLGATLLVFRLVGAECSYVEMAHAEDVRQWRVDWHKAAQGDDSGSESLANAVRSEFRLFGGELERGVILRTRMRAVLLPRDGDLQQAADLYEQFLAEPPPLAV